MQKVLIYITIYDLKKKHKNAICSIYEIFANHYLVMLNLVVNPFLGKIQDLSRDISSIIVV